MEGGSASDPCFLGWWREVEDAGVRVGGIVSLSCVC